jgi:CheY-like chemotaxis protein
MNLVINASQAMGERGGEIDVKTCLAKGGSFSDKDGCHYSAEDYVRLQVSDTGCGMAEEEIAKIFDPFFTTKLEGHGLGLAVVHGIVHSHHGAINVASTPGRGTTFEVLFRRHEMASSVQIVAGAARAEVTGTVLLVEDEDQLRIATARALQKRGFSVVSAADGPTAVKLFHAQAEDIGVVVLDLRLPGLTGQEVFRQIREIRPKMKVMFTSAYDAKIADALSDGFTLRFLQKPYRFSDLFAELHRALSGSPKVLSANGPS